MLTYAIYQRRKQLLFDADRYTQLHWLGPQCSYSYSAATWPTATATTQLLGLHMPKPQVQVLFVKQGPGSAAPERFFGF